MVVYTYLLYFSGIEIAKIQYYDAAIVPLFMCSD